MQYVYNNSYCKLSKDMPSSVLTISTPTNKPIIFSNPRIFCPDRKFPNEYILYRNLYDDKNYSNLYLLEGNKLLIHRYRAHNDNRSKCGNCRRTSYYSNIIIVINLDNFEIIYQF